MPYEPPAPRADIKEDRASKLERIQKEINRLCEERDKLMRGDE
jgi:hypothetical protein